MSERISQHGVCGVNIGYLPCLLSFRGILMVIFLEIPGVGALGLGVVADDDDPPWCGADEGRGFRTLVPGVAASMLPTGSREPDGTGVLAVLLGIVADVWRGRLEAGVATIVDDDAIVAFSASISSLTFCGNLSQALKLTLTTLRCVPDPWFPPFVFLEDWAAP